MATQAAQATATTRARVPARTEGSVYFSPHTMAPTLKSKILCSKICSCKTYFCVAVDAGVVSQVRIVKCRPGHRHHLLAPPWTRCVPSLSGPSLPAGDLLLLPVPTTAIAVGQTTAATILMTLAKVETRFWSVLTFLGARTVSLCAIPVDGTAEPTLAGG